LPIWAKKAHNLQLFLVAKVSIFADIKVSRKDKLIEKLQGRPNNFTWDEAVKLMSACGFKLHNKGGSARMFVHVATRTKVRLHEPHPQPTLLPYMMDQLLDGLRAAGEIE
jgi:predicted RNA binding protein YcfA (HicA-like mRNA interferase family)